MNGKQIVSNKADNIEEYIKNSIPLSLLLQYEKDGLGDVTISELLTALQNISESNKTDNGEILKQRKRQ